MLRNHVPGQLVIQLTDRCNALCPQCGMRRTASYSRSRLSLDTVKRIIDACAERGVEAVSFTGGEPFIYFEDLIELLRHASMCGIKYTRTGTNGFLFMESGDRNFDDRIHRIAERLSSTNLYTLWISLDSIDTGVHERMRGLSGVVSGIRKALPIFRQHGLFPSANLGINWNLSGNFNKSRCAGISEFDYFRDGFRRFYNYAINLGFTIANACYPMSADTANLDPVYQAVSGDDVVTFTGEQKREVFRALFDTIPEFRSRIRIFSPRSSLLQLIRVYSGDAKTVTPCRGGIDYFYINAATGTVFPCGYRGSEDLGDFQEVNPVAVGPENACFRCDWECFRDPSVMFEPVLDILNNPLRLMRQVLSDASYYRIWLNDIRYYRSCDWFNGRQPPDGRRLARFKLSDNYSSADCHGDGTLIAGDVLNRIGSDNVF